MLQCSAMRQDLQSPTFSIIIPAFNEELYLMQCLDSVINQTLQPFEIIVVDNASTDRTAAIAKQYKGVKVLREPQKGTYYARERGFAVAHGTWLVRIDADTMLPPDWLATVRDYIQTHADTQALTGRGVFYDVPLPTFAGWLQAAMYQYAQYPAVGSYMLWGAMMAVRRDAWAAVRARCHDRPDLDEDIDLSLALIDSGLPIAFVSSLIATASLRRNKTSPIETARYLSSWPKNYYAKSQYIAALYICFLTLITIAGGWFLWVIVQSAALRHAPRLIMSADSHKD